MANVPKKTSNNIYKKGKLSKNARFSSRRIKWTPIIIILCILATFIFAIIFGNMLGDKASNLQESTPTTNGAPDITPPSADKVAPQEKLQAYFVDLQYASPDTNISLSVITATPRERGNAIFVEMKNAQGEIIYFSDKTNELGFEHQDNLPLSRMKNHFEYYSDFAVGCFKSNFSANLNTEKALKLQTNEILLLMEACNTAFDEMVIEFSNEITNKNLIHYQTYLLNLKLACPETPIGIKLSPSFLENPDNAACVAGLIGIADFFVLDYESKNAAQIENSLKNLIYFTKRYDCVIMLADTEQSEFDEKIALIKDKGIENFIVK